MRRISRFVIVLLLSSWTASGWQQFYNFPPGAQKAQAAPEVYYLRDAADQNVCGVGADEEDLSTTQGSTNVSKALTTTGHSWWIQFGSETVREAGNYIINLRGDHSNSGGNRNVIINFSRMNSSCGLISTMASSNCTPGKGEQDWTCTITTAQSSITYAANDYLLVEVTVNSNGHHTLQYNGSAAPFDSSVTMPEVNSAPNLTVNQPDGTGDTVTVGDSYNINYALDDPEEVVTAAFHYDTDNTGLDGTAISGACATAAEGIGATCAWDTTGMTPGSYYIYGTTSDGVNPSVSDYSPGQITIESAVGLGIVGPTDVTFNVGNPGDTTETTFSAEELVVVTDGGAGWSLTVSSTNLTSGGNTILNSNVRIRRDGVVSGGSDNYTIWSGIISNVSEPSTTEALDAARTVGTRSFGTVAEETNVRPTLQVVLPPSQTPATYTGTVTFTIA